MRPLALPLLPILLLASCASDSDTSTETGFRPFSERIDEQGGYKQDAEGNWTPRINRQSSLVKNRESPYFKGSFEGKTYATGEYAKKSWLGGKEVSRPTYAGDTDGSRFALQNSGYRGQAAREGGTYATSGYTTSGYGTSAAREAAFAPHARPSNARVDRQREVQDVPAIMNWREQRSLSLGQTKTLTGR